MERTAASGTPSGMPLGILVLVILTSVPKITEASSHLLQSSHFSGHAGRELIQNINPIDRYEEINSGRITLEHSTPTTTRYLGPDFVSKSEHDGRFRRDISLPDGAVFDNFDHYVPFGRRGPTPVATFTDSNFDFTNGYYTAPYSGTFFFLFHGPQSSEDDLVVGLDVIDKDGNRDQQVVMHVTTGTSGLLPVLLSLEAGEKVDMNLVGSTRIRSRFSAIFNGFNLQRSTVAPTHLCFPHRIRQSAFTMLWKDTPIGADPTRRRRQSSGRHEAFLLEDGYDTVVNTGAHFNVDTGNYTVEFPGLYAFFLSFRASRNNKRQPSQSVTIMRNGDKVGEARTDVTQTMGPTLYERASTAIVLELKAGEVIRLQQQFHGSPIYPLGDDMLIFTGFLL